MPKFALYEASGSQPYPVVGWYDTDLLNYPNLPAEDKLFLLTEAQWQAHLINPSGFAIDNDTLVSYSSPAAAPTLAMQGQAAIAKGLTVLSESDHTIDGTYITNGIAFGSGDIASEAQYIATFGGFTTGSSLDWTLVGGSQVTFTSTATFLAVAKAVAQYLSAIRAAVQAGTALPQSTVTIA